MRSATAGRTVTVSIPGTPSPALSPNARRRGNVWAQREATRELREVTYWETLRLCADGGQVVVVVPFECPVSIHEHIIWPKSKGVLPDPDSIATYCKAALDGIVDAGIIAGDSHKHIASVTTSQEKGTDGQGSIVITITEAAGAARDGGDDA